MAVDIAELEKTLEIDLEDETAEEEQKKMVSGLHSILSNRIGKLLALSVDEPRIGFVLDSSATYTIKDKPPKRQPDVSFVSIEKMPVPLDTELPFAPDLAVEIVSKNDKDYEIDEKVKQYQEIGVKLLWLVRHTTQSVEVFTFSDGLRSRRLIGDDLLEGLDVIKGFQIPVKKLFEL